MKPMATIKMSDADAARDLHAVLAKVRQGVEVVIEQDNVPVAVIKRSESAGRMISKVVADLKARGSDAVMDDDFASDVEKGTKGQGY